MEINNRKALGSYVMILMVFSVFMSFILMLLLNFAYEPDHPSCRDINFEAESVCKASNGFKVKISNIGGTRSLNFNVNENLDPYDSLGPDEEKGITLRNSDAFLLVPTTISDDGMAFICKSQGVKLNMETLGKC